MIEEHRLDLGGNTLTPRMMSMSSVRPLGLDIFTWVRPQGALLPGERTDVPGAVAQQGKGLPL